MSQPSRKARELHHNTILQRLRWRCRILLRWLVPLKKKLGLMEMTLIAVR
jgi:hypothetical protein